MSKRFRRTVEDFVCERCGFKVKGSGYTNHCPRCLWSKHVDVYPGDREEACEGLMEPMAVEARGDNYRIIHRCTRCGAVRKNRVAAEDDFEVLLQIVSQGNQGV